MHSSISYSKNKVPYQMNHEERYSTFRAEIDLLNYIKRPKKYIWGQFQSSANYNGLIIGSKLVCFVGLTCRYNKWTGHELVKRGVCVLANFSKTAEKKQNAIKGLQVRLTLTSNQQTDQKDRFTLRGDVST